MSATTRILSLALLPGFAMAATTVLYNPASPAIGPFPSDVLTTPDPLQRTGLRLNLPVPDCATRYTECQQTALLDQADGFSLRPRIRVRFSGPVNTATLRDGVFIQGPSGRIAINQVVWDPATNTMFGKPDVALAQETRYTLVITDAVKGPTGAAVGPDPTVPRTITGVITTEPPPAPILGLIAATTFTTMSATAWLEHAREVLPYVPTLVRLAEPHSSFRIADLASLTLHFQNGANPVRFNDFSLPLEPALLLGVDRLVMGSFRSPRFLEDDQSIRSSPTLPGFEVPTRTDEIGFNAILPSTAQPASGYPVVIFGHGFGDSRFGGPTAVSATLARAGFATVSISAVGHGFGPFSTVTFVDRAGKGVTLPALGRSVDLNRDGTIEANEGCAVISPVPYGLRDCFRQTVVDLMQLTRAIRAGIDLDGDGKPDLDGSRIYYGGQSLGAMYGTIFSAMEPGVRAAALNVGGATQVEIARISPAYRGIATQMLGSYMPSLLNQGNTFNEDYPLPDQPVRVTTIPGALEIQNAFDLSEWLGMPGDPISFASRLRPKPVLFQFARADRTMPNPASSALVRAAGAQSATWLYRHDLARERTPGLPLDPHPFLVLFISLDGSGVQLPGIAALAVSIDAQQQIAGFFGSDGATIPDPNGLSAGVIGIRVFEIPAALPFDLGY